MTEKNDPDSKLQSTLDDDDIEDVSLPTRRSALVSVGAALVGAVFGAGVLSPQEAEACPNRTGRSDRDPSDRVSYGRTGLTDRDPSDAAYCGGGRGRVRTRGRRRCTDRDLGRGSDPVNYPC